MFDKLDDILMRLEEVLNQLSEPDGCRCGEVPEADEGAGRTPADRRRI